MEWAKYVAEGLFFLVAMPLMAFQSFEIIHAFIEFIADFGNNDFTNHM